MDLTVAKWSIDFTKKGVVKQEAANPTDPHFTTRWFLREHALHEEPLPPAANPCDSRWCLLWPKPESICRSAVYSENHLVGYQVFESGDCGVTVGGIWWENSRRKEVLGFFSPSSMASTLTKRLVRGAVGCVT